MKNINPTAQDIDPLLLVIALVGDTFLPPDLLAKEIHSALTPRDRSIQVTMLQLQLSFIQGTQWNSQDITSCNSVGSLFYLLNCQLLRVNLSTFSYFATDCVLCLVLLSTYLFILRARLRSVVEYLQAGVIPLVFTTIEVQILVFTMMTCVNPSKIIRSEISPPENGLDFGDF